MKAVWTELAGRKQQAFAGIERALRPRSPFARARIESATKHDHVGETECGAVSRRRPFPAARAGCARAGRRRLVPDRRPAAAGRGSAAPVRHHAAARRQRRSHPGGARGGGPRRRRPRRCRALRPKRRQLVLRLNRLFWSDGTAGIREMGRLVRHYALAGFRSEIQVRYHPPEGREGDIEGFEQFVATAVRRLGKRRAVAGFSITNEANLPISPNTSDGAYEGVVDALVRGVIVARRELRKLGRAEARRRLQRDVALEPGQRPPVLGGHRRASGRGPLPQGGGQRRASRSTRGSSGRRRRIPGPHRRRRGRRGADARARLLHAEGGARAARSSSGSARTATRRTSAAARNRSGATSSRRSRRSRSGRAPSA